MIEEYKAKNIDDFLNHLRKNNKNHIENTEGIGEVFEECKKKNQFAIVCLKCGSTDVVIIGEDGIDYGGQTGYSPGENVIKCKCGNAITWWA